MEDAISWSYDLLAPGEQELFCALAVFAGPFDLASAESTCRSGDALDLLTRLADRSMVSVRRPASGGTRYELLETLREYGRSRMNYDRRAEVFESHAAHFAALAGFVEKEMRTPREPQAIELAEGSFADLRASQRFALETGDLDTAFGLIVSAREFAMRAMRYELLRVGGRRLPGGRCARAPARPGAHGSPRVRRLGPRRVRARGRPRPRDPGP